MIEHTPERQSAGSESEHVFRLLKIYGLVDGARSSELQATKRKATAQKDLTSIPRVTKRIGSLRHYIKHRGIGPNKGKASTAQVDAWKKQLAEELELRETLRKQLRQA